MCNGRISIEEACKELNLESVRRVKDFAKIDVSRLYRTGIPEIIFAEGKRGDEVADTAMALATAKDFALISRAREKDVEAIKRCIEENEEFEIDYNGVAKTVIVKKKGYEFKKIGKIGLIAAGTADMPVAEEAGVVAGVCGCEVIKAYDVGVATVAAKCASRKE